MVALRLSQKPTAMAVMKYKREQTHNRDENKSQAAAENETEIATHFPELGSGGQHVNC